jgi:hypothetical protein
MAGIKKKFTNAYSRLCHFVAIRKDTASVTAAEDGVIRASIYLCENALAPDNKEISENVKAFFSLSFSEDEIEQAVERLSSAGQVIRNRDGSTALSPEALAEITECTSASARLEADVKFEWLSAVRRVGLFPNNYDEVEVWHALQAYLAAMFTRHGVQTLEVLSPTAVADESVDIAPGDVLDEVIEHELPRLTSRNGRKLLQSFLRDRTPLRNRYLSELLDGAFSFFALTVDDATRTLLRQNLPPLKLFVDTNFIFGLLELHSNPFVAISKQLADFIREQNFPFQLYYHPITAIEFKSVIDYYHRRLAGGKWSPSMSRALLRVGELSSVERKFHEINSEQSIVVDDFFARYSNLDRLLGPVGIKPFRITYEPWLEDDETLDLVGKYKQYLSDRLNVKQCAEREKPFDVLRHDIILWRTLQKVRQHNAGFLGAGAFFLTCDYTFWRFEHQELSRRSSGVSVLPNVFLQLLRPFVPRTDDFDRSFVSTFALPEFRTIHSASAQAVSRVAGIVRLYADLPEDIAVTILTDEALVTKVAKLDESDPTIHSLIESAIASEASRWQEEAVRLRQQLELEQNLSKEKSAELRRASIAAEENVRALTAVNQQLEDERIARLRTEESAAAEKQRHGALVTEQEEVVDGLVRRAEQAEAAEKVARVELVARRQSEDVRETTLRRTTSTLFALVHVLVAFVACTFIVRYATAKAESAIVGGILYAGIAAVTEFAQWFQRSRQRRLMRLLWLISIVVGVGLTWCKPDQIIVLSVFESILGSSLIALLTLPFQQR